MVSVAGKTLADFPELVAQIDREKHPDLEPAKIKAGSHKRLSWKCETGHEWASSVNVRSRHDTKCEYCRGRIPTPEQNLAVLFPDIAKDWHPTKNGNVKPSDVTAKSNKKVWWKCPVADDHEWDTRVANRTANLSKCPCCTGQKVSVTNSLATRFPEIATEWHPTKNGELTPNDVVYGSGRRVWWKCDNGPDHEWPTRICTRTSYRGCPFCTGRKVSITNCFSTIHPQLTKYWHPEKNKEITPEKVAANSMTKRWWKCPVADDHEWTASPATMGGNYKEDSDNIGCPYCSGHRVSKDNNFLARLPKAAKLWHPTKNGNLKPSGITYGSGRRVWWKCPVADDHEWTASPGQIGTYRRAGNTGCPYCSGQRVSKDNNLLARFPKAAKLWHPDKNTKNPKEVIGQSGTKYWWKCKKEPDHEWNISPAEVVKSVYHSRSGREGGCPHCYRAGGREWLRHQRVSVTYNLQVKFPDVAKLWHPTKNGDLTPSDVTHGASTFVWWKCPVADDHEWRDKVSERTVLKGRKGKKKPLGCPYCAGQRVSITNSLATKYPDIVEYWHPTKNGNLKPSRITPSSNRRVWWKCPVADDHEWTAPPADIVRSKKNTDTSGCSCCAGLKVSVTNSLATIFPDMVREWHPTKNGNLTPEKIVGHTRRKVWWQCQKKNEHIWHVSPGNRYQHRGHISGCPECHILPRSKTEIYIGFELSHFFKVDFGDHKIRIARKLYDVDIKIPELNLIIEYDGSYWHKNKFDDDAAKTNALKGIGWEVIRVRENPLSKVTENDIQVPSQHQIKYKADVDKLLKQIEKVCNIQIDGLNEYLKLKEPINNRAAYKYIATLQRDAQQSTL